jgi:hypothetical protein
VVNQFVALANDDPITAPVPAVNAPAGEDEIDPLNSFAPDFSGTLDLPKDSVFIRAGQAGNPRSPAHGAGRDKEGGEDRQSGRSGRLKLRRKPQDRS